MGGWLYAVFFVFVAYSAVEGVCFHGDDIIQPVAFVERAARPCESSIRLAFLFSFIAPLLLLSCLYLRSSETIKDQCRLVNY